MVIHLLKRSSARRPKQAPQRSVAVAEIACAKNWSGSDSAQDVMADAWWPGKHSLSRWSWGSASTVTPAAGCTVRHFSECTPTIPEAQPQDSTFLPTPARNHKLWYPLSKRSKSSQNLPWIWFTAVIAVSLWQILFWSAKCEGRNMTRFCPGLRPMARILIKFCSQRKVRSFVTLRVPDFLPSVSFIARANSYHNLFLKFYSCPGLPAQNPIICCSQDLPLYFFSLFFIARPSWNKELETSRYRRYAEFSGSLCTLHSRCSEFSILQFSP